MGSMAEYWDSYYEDDFEQVVHEMKERAIGDKKASFFAKGISEKDMVWLEEPVIFDDFERQVDLYFSWVQRMYDKRSRYLAKGWIHQNFKTGEHFMKQVMVDYNALLKVVRTTNDKKDQYLCPNVFSFPTNRQASTIREIQAAYSDIDTYKIQMPDGTIGSITRARMYEGLEELVAKGEIPKPNVTIEANGTQVVWLHEPVPYWVETEWTEFQNYIYEKLKSFGADAKAKDVSRFMRATGSIHSGINQKVIMKVHSFDRYKFEELTSYVPGLKVDRRKSGQKKRKTYKTKLESSKVVSNRLWTKYQWGSAEQLRSLHMGRVQDLETLRDLRHGNMLGCREMACFLYHLNYLRAHGNAVEADAATWSFYQSFSRVPGDEYGKRELLVRVRSSERDWRRWVIDAESARYNFTNEWMIDKLNITKTEQKKMLIIIDDTEQQRRNTEFQKDKRRKNGVKERAEYEQERKADKEHMLDMLKRHLERNPKAKRKDLAELLGVSVFRIDQLKREFKSL